MMAFRDKDVMGGMLLLVCILILGGAWVAQADEEWRKRHHRMDSDRRGMMHGPGMGAMQEHFARWLELDQTQAQEMHKLYAAYKKEMVRQKAEIRVAEMDLADLLEEKNPDQRALERAVEKLESLRAKLLQYQIQTLMKTRDFLREEQFQRFKNWIANQMREGGAWHHGRAKHHGGYGQRKEYKHQGMHRGGMMGKGMMDGMEGSGSP